MEKKKKWNGQNGSIDIDWLQIHGWTKNSKVGGWVNRCHPSGEEGLASFLEAANLSRGGTTAEKVSPSGKTLSKWVIVTCGQIPSGHDAS